MLPHVNHLSILTFNIQAYITCDKNNNCEEMYDVLNETHADIICLQENIVNHIRPTFGSYHLVSYCETERYLVNSIYVHRSLLRYIHGVNQYNITCSCPTPRCATVIKIGHISIANIHLCGGRFDDKDYTKLTIIKADEVHQLIKKIKPDVIVGDFNAEATMEDSVTQLKNYPLYQQLSTTEKKEFIRYYTSHQIELSTYNYHPAYNRGQIGATSIYGGTPDWMYYNPIKLNPDASQLIDMLDYSDHNAVFVQFSLTDR